MNELHQLLLQEKKELDKILIRVEKFLKKAPEGSLRIAKVNNTNQFYWRTDVKDTCGSYIRHT